MPLVSAKTNDNLDVTMESSLEQVCLHQKKMCRLGEKRERKVHQQPWARELDLLHICKCWVHSSAWWWWQGGENIQNIPLETLHIWQWTCMDLAFQKASRQKKMQSICKMCCLKKIQVIVPSLRNYKTISSEEVESAKHMRLWKQKTQTHVTFWFP